MPSYAVLGATGSTGQNLLQLLAASPENEINVYVRSRSKLEKMFPDIIKQSNIHIFEGSLNDLDLMRRCVSSVSVVFSVVASNVNTRNLSIAQDSAQVLVDTLQSIRKQDSKASLPRLLFLSSASVNNNIQGQSGIGRWVAHMALCNIYDDLMKAETFLRQHQDWLQVVFVTPGVLSSDPEQRGHALSVTDMGEAGGGAFLSYVDLAAGMIEIAQSNDKYDWKGVVVQPLSSSKFDWQAPINLANGLRQSLWQKVW